MQLAERKWGVIGIRYREVPCDHCPDNPATLPNGASPAPPSEGAPGSWQPSADKRPGGKMCFKSSLDRSDSSVSSTGGNSNAQGNAHAQHNGNSNGGGNSGGQQLRSQWFPSWFPSNSLLSSWQDLTAKMDPWSATAPDGQSAYCGTLEGHSSLTFKVGFSQQDVNDNRIEHLVHSKHSITELTDSAYTATQTLGSVLLLLG